MRIQSLLFTPFSYMPTLLDTAVISCSPTGYWIFWIKWTFQLFCALVWNLAHFFCFVLFCFFFSKFDLFYSFLVSGKEWMWTLTACTSCKTSHESLRRLGQFGGRCWEGGGWRVGGLLTVGGGGGQMKNRGSPESTTEVGISAFLHSQFPMLPR